MSAAAQKNSPPPVAILIERPNLLKEKIGGSLSPALYNKMEQAVEHMAIDFEAWMRETTDELHAMWQQMTGKSFDPQTLEALMRTALEVKSLGETYGYPLATRVAHSLCRLVAKMQKGPENPAHKIFVEAHVKALKAIMRDNIKNAENPIGVALASELEANVARL
jgi:hypothetical protein